MSHKANWIKVSFYVLLSGSLLTFVILISRSLRKLKSTEYGLQYNIHKKTLDDAAKVGGLHFGPPGFKFIKFPSTYVTVDLPDGPCLSRDGIPVVVSVTFQYQMPEKWLLPAILKYRNFHTWSTVVEAAGESAIQHACSAFFVSNFQNKRDEIPLEMENFLRMKLEGNDGNEEEGIYAEVKSVQLRNLDLPDSYQKAVYEKQTAVEDIANAENQRDQEVTKTKTKLNTAKQEAIKILDTSRNEANLTITESIIKAEEILYSFKSESAVLVKVKKSLNLTTNGILSYATIQMYEKALKLRVTTGEPAKLSRKDEF